MQCRQSSTVFSSSMVLRAWAMLFAFSCTTAAGQAKHELATFSGADGIGPVAGVLSDRVGNLYGTTQYGGSGYGVIFEVSPQAKSVGAWTETILYSFSSFLDGSSPSGPLIEDRSGNLYGTTEYGGTSDLGTVFELSPPGVSGGSWTKQTIYSFRGSPDGEVPLGNLVMDGSGNLYGTTSYGGRCNWGSVFELSPPAAQGGGWLEKVLHNFSYTCGGVTTYDGGIPLAGLTLGNGGAVYGTTYDGGRPYQGTVFRLDPPSAHHSDWIEEVIYVFAGGSDGAEPTSSLILDGQGNLFGTTEFGGNSNCYFMIPGCGTVYELSPPRTVGSSWTKTTLYTFAGGADGANPIAGLAVDTKGNLYGSTSGGGSTACDTNFSEGCGVVFELSPPSELGLSWTPTTLYSFRGNADGQAPMGGVVLDNSSRLYGTTFGGGDKGCLWYSTKGCGTVFEIVP